jgi:NAD-dependent dihydropyrimidine dehydrogenase PreA subunit
LEIDQNKCERCTLCIAYCPVGAIKIDKKQKRIYIDQDECVECSACWRSGVCEYDALIKPELKWPRTVRSSLSDPLIIHPETRIPGRGTEEIKTNDVTGRFGPGYAGMAIEMGRPGIATSMRDVEKVTKRLAAIGVELEPLNPVTTFVKDKNTGILSPELINERVLSAIIEFKVPLEKVSLVIQELEGVANELDTVFSFGISSIVDKNGNIPLMNILNQIGQNTSVNGKTNVGLGRPLYNFGKERK